MPQTRFVTEKAFAQGLKPIVVINKIDREGARPDWVLDQTFDLFDRLGATDEQLDFPVIYASAVSGYASDDDSVREGNMHPLLDAIVEQVPPPPVDSQGPFQMQISSLDYSSYVGAIGIGRIQRGSVKTNTPIRLVDRDGKQRDARILQVMRSRGLERVQVDLASAGDIVAINGIEGIRISDTLCDPTAVEALPSLTVDEPTVSMSFQVNDSPMSGRDGKYVTSRQIRERLDRELIHNVALRVEDTEDPDRFLVSGRGELHLAILIENMRREGYEIAIGRPQVIVRDNDGTREEPYEQLTVDVENDTQGAVMELLGERRGEMQDMTSDGRGRTRVDYIIPARGLIGFRTDFLTATAGTGLLYHSFSHYGPIKGGPIATRRNGALISMATGKALAYALFNLQERGRLFIGHADEVYEGMVIGLHSRGNDLTVNPLKAKQLTNIRAAGTDENLLLTPPIKLTLERAMELIDDDELIEVTPASIRVRKRYLKEHERRREARKAS